MALPTTCTLVYTVTSMNATAAALATALGAVTLYSSAGDDPVLFGLYDCTVASDTTGTAGASATRTIVLTLGAGFFALFPSAASWVGAFPGFYTRALELGVQCLVAASAPVFA